MKVIGIAKVTVFIKQHTDAKSSITTWLLEAEEANWVSPIDIKQRYAHASFLADNRVIFNIRGNNYRLVVRVDYEVGVVLILWVGTHQEYDRQTF